MDAINKLLDRAKEVCSLKTDTALAARLGVSRQLLSNWRKANDPIADDRIVQLARVAKEDPGTWLVAIHAELAQGETARTWLNIAKKLGYAATLAFLGLAATTLPGTAYAATAVDSGRSSCNLYIMSTRRFGRRVKRRNRRHSPGNLRSSFGLLQYA